MGNIFKHKHSNDEVNLIHIGKMENNNETVVIYELELDKTIMVMLLSEFNHDYEQHEYSEHNCFTKHTGNTRLGVRVVEF